ncbi:hypothetical protein [Flagellimonas meishanensis]|uniref:hypothetical protein n=1 Tax=Flagellimonas meishanensis TaxID=2873264 RepID=UPI001CA7ACA2|nr:hypothetical protein [[Muricauda] meishanensis]
MDKNIFKRIESSREVPNETKNQVISNISAVEKGKDISRLFNTKFYGAVVNFFKLN